MKSKKNCHTNDLMEMSIDDCANVDDENKNNRIPSYVKKYVNEIIQNTITEKGEEIAFQTVSKSYTGNTINDKTAEKTITLLFYQ